MKLNSNQSRFFTKFELTLWISSIIIIAIAFLSVTTKDYLSLITSLIGCTALTFVSKANVLGQILTVVFSIFYGIISLSFGYYGEMITYLFMTTPIAIASIITWCKNPSKQNKNEIAVNHIATKEWLFLLLLAFVVTVILYFVLKHFNTTNLYISTLSTTTSFVAVYLTMRRSEYYALGYATNDIVLIVLWILASIQNAGYISMVICFVIFLVNDSYGFINWRRLRRKQAK